MNYGVSSMTAELRRVALRKPGNALLSADPQRWHYGPAFDAGRVEAQHAEFVGLLERQDVEILWMGGDDRGIADAVFTYDASLMTPAGAILMNPGKPLRAGEQELHRIFYEDHGIPVVGEVTGAARIEGGDTLWLDDAVLAVGRGFRTNQAGIDRLEAMLAPMGIEVRGFDLPVYYGADACLHLMSLTSLVDTRKAAVALPFLPVGLFKLMRDLDYDLIELPLDEFEQSGTLSGNLLATAPGHCIMIDGFPKTRAVLEAAGTRVEVFSGDALCIGCEGGPTCLSRPILRNIARHSS